MQRHSLRLYSSVLQDSGFVGDITTRAQNWKRSIRAQGGYWQGSFQLRGSPSELINLFHSMLGFHVEERVGSQVTWEGMVYEVELLHEGTRRRRTLDKLANAVKVRYTDPTTNIATVTAWDAAAIQEASIRRYGRREEAITLGKVNAASATAQRATYLKENAWPWARPVSATLQKGEALLDVRACGYVFTMNWRFLSAANQTGTTANVSIYVNDIITTDCIAVDTPAVKRFVTATKIKENTLQVRKATAIDARAWDALKMLTELGDASGNPWQIFVDTGRAVVYQPIDIVPRYYIQSGGLYSAAGQRVQVNAWQVRPAVMRDMTFPIVSAEPGSFLGDARDVFIEEVEAFEKDGDGQLSLKTSLFSEAAIMDALQKEREFENRLMEERAREREKAQRRDRDD